MVHGLHAVYDHITNTFARLPKPHVHVKSWNKPSQITPPRTTMILPVSIYVERGGRHVTVVMERSANFNYDFCLIRFG